MKYTYWNEKHNTLYINGRQLLPNTQGMNFKAHCKAYNEAFAMSYPDRIKMYACDAAKHEIEEELAKHPGCKVSEYCNV